ncbi:MAG: T9SS type A sorting domain-containing protein, partial [Ignavibacteriaceae bacterium]
PMSVYAVDVEGDGDIDMISGFWYDAKIAWYENDGNENFTTHIITTNAAGANTVYAIDVDGDGDMDVLSASFFDDKIAWYENLNPITPDLPFDDDFTGGPDPAWNVFGDYWFFDNDKVYSNVDPTYIYQYMIVGDNNWQDYTFEVDVLGTSGTDKAICFRVQDTQNFYMLHLIGPIQYHHIELYRYVNGQYTVIYQNPNYPVQNNVNYHLKVETYGNNIKIYINGVFEAEVSDDTFDSGGVALAGGWNGYAPCYVEFDNVSVYNEQNGDGLVDFDIKPQSCPNPLNVKSRGKFPVAILGTNDFDVTDIDPSTLLLEGVAPIRWSIEDVSTPLSSLSSSGQAVLNPSFDVCDCTTEGPDGYDDLTLKFNTQELVAALGTVNNGDELELTITGSLLDGTTIEGSDCVIIKAKGNLGKQLTGGSTNKPDKYALIGNYPNPFNPVTTISYSLPVKSQVELVVYNTLGESVVQLVNEEKEAGSYSAKFDAKSLPSGIYFYRLQAGSFVETKKMVLMK